MISESLSPSLVTKAHCVIQEKVFQTPVIVSPALSSIASARRNSSEHNLKPGTEIELFFKCENLQKTGSFKFRGAMYSTACLTDEELKRGLLTTSSGNHAKALATAAQEISREKGFPIPVFVVMPENAMETKVIAAKRFGAEVFSSGRSWGERDAVLRVLHNRTGATIVSSSSDPEIILGQGTIGLEFVSQVKRLHNLSLDAIIAPCGGGGMLSGLGVALRDSSINVFGAEPDEGGADDAARGRADGKRIETVDSATIADGLRCPVGRLPWEIIKNPEYIEDIYAVGDVQIRTAMKLILEYMGMVVEPSAAVPLAVVLFNKEFRSYVASRPRAWRVGVVLSGGNVGVDDFNAMLL